ncbi:MAG TPA: MFS transporter [Baekduia sp.]|nr:MFS transporter [Baekduia sp.]
MARTPLPRTFWWLWTGALINRLGTFLEPFLALYLTTARDLSVARAGTVVAMIGAGSVIAQPLGGGLADRVGRRPTLVGGMVASGIAIGALALARPVWLIALLALVVGITGDIYRPAAAATVADVVPVADRRRAGALMFWAINLGFSVAGTVGGVLAAHGYGLLFALDALTCLGYATVVWLTVPETRPAEARHPDAPGWSTVLRDRLAMTFFGLNLAVVAVYATLFTIMPLAMRADGLGPATYGAVAALNGVLIVVLNPLLVAWLLRWKVSHALAAGALLTGAAMLVVAATGGLAGYVTAVVLITLGEIATQSVSSGLIAEIAPPALRGRYAGAFGLTFGAAFTITPLAGGALLGQDGAAAAPWVLAAALAGAATVGMLALGPALEARRAVAV